MLSLSFALAMCSAYVNLVVRVFAIVFANLVQFCEIAVCV